MYLQRLLQFIGYLLLGGDEYQADCFSSWYLSLLFVSRNWSLPFSMRTMGTNDA